MSHFTEKDIYQHLQSEYQEELAALVTCTSQKQNAFVFYDPMISANYLLTKAAEMLSEQATVIYYDLNHVFTPKNLLSYMTSNLIQNSGAKLKDLVDFADKYVPNLKPKLTFKTRPELTIDYSINPATIYKFLDELFDSFESIAADTGKQLVIIFDNYDRIPEIDKRKSEDAFRNKIFAAKKVNYIFSCSNEAAVSDIFDKKYAPRYNLKKYLIFNAPAQQKLVQYVTALLEKAGHTIAPGVADSIVTSANGIHNLCTLCQRILCRQGDKTITQESLRKVMAEIFFDLSPSYNNTWVNLSPHQKILLYTIATKGGTQIFASSFLFANDLGSVPSVQTSINAMIKKEILLKKEKMFYFIDNFFKEWIKNNFY